ncbi:MAG: hypothetical protein JWL62_2673, partial [Hyphomicrobiales bacterium]|nr:hypothetical protein [Hyphomicrobiales bacterium]
MTLLPTEPATKPRPKGRHEPALSAI